MKNVLPSLVIADLHKGKRVSRRRAEHAICFIADLVELWRAEGVSPVVIDIYAKNAKFIAEKCCIR